MRTLYEWIIIYENGSQFRQYDGYQENLYKDIDFTKVNSFVITNGYDIFGVNLKHKCFIIGKTLIYVEGNSKFNYFRRNEVDISTGNKIQAHRVWQVIQFNNFELEINEQTNQAKLKWVPH